MPVAFRAGGEPRGVPAFGAAPSVLLADVSEFEPQINDPIYLHWSRAVIIRAAYGDAHDDAAWYGGARRDALHKGGARFIGIYQYLVAGQDAAAQAHALIRLVGKLRPGEKLICDLEEGNGNQLARYRQWSAVIAAAYGTSDGAKPWLYSGLDFAATHGLHADWLAAYQGTEPATPHLLWQFSPSYPVPGVGLADCSVFRGTIDQLASYAYGGKPAPPPSPGNWQEVMMRELPELRQGASGEDVRTVQALCGARGQSVAIDGRFGVRTEQAVRACQDAAKVAVDGVVDPTTWTVLVTGSAP